MAAKSSRFVFERLDRPFARSEFHPARLAVGDDMHRVEIAKTVERRGNLARRRLLGIEDLRLNPRPEVVKNRLDVIDAGIDEEDFGEKNFGDFDHFTLPHAEDCRRIAGQGARFPDWWKIRMPRISRGADCGRPHARTDRG